MNRRHFKKRFREILGNVVGYKIYDIAPHKYAIVNREFDRNNWFAHSAHLCEILEKKNITMVVDAGANEGQFAEFVRNNVGYDGKIYSFEPSPFPFEKLKMKSSDDDRWHVFNVGLGSAEGELDFHASEASVLSSFLRPNEYYETIFNENAKKIRMLKVKIDTLSAFSDRHAFAGERIFLKLDTQGFDLEVFAGAKTILKDIYVLQAELSMKAIYEHMPTWSECISTYEKSGFRIAGFYPVLYDGLDVVEYDCLMTR